MTNKKRGLYDTDATNLSSIANLIMILLCIIM